MSLKNTSNAPNSDYFDPPLENTNVQLVDEYIRALAQCMIAGCEQCCESTEITFDCVLDEITGCDPTTTEYLLCRPAWCPRCFREVNERTMVLR